MAGAGIRGGCRLVISPFVGKPAAGRLASNAVYSGGFTVQHVSSSLCTGLSAQPCVVRGGLIWQVAACRALKRNAQAAWQGSVTRTTSATALTSNPTIFGEI